jgi:hypothetical protein
MLGYPPTPSVVLYLFLIRESCIHVLQRACKCSQQAEPSCLLVVGRFACHQLSLETTYCQYCSQHLARLTQWLRQLYW